jgi:hypothetical protein
MPSNHQQEDFQEEDFTVVKAGGHLSAHTYRPEELDRLARDICSRNSQFIGEVSGQRKDGRGYALPSVKLNIFQQGSKKIVLLGTVSDWGQPRLFRSLADLDGALCYYRSVSKANKIDLHEAMLLIPVAELGRNHYRLLVITKDNIKYYDSKNVLVTNGIGASVSAAIATYKATGDAVRAVTSNTAAEETENRDTVSAKALRYLGTFAAKVPAYYAEYRHPVLETCRAFFPQLSAQEISLGDQGAFNVYDSGPIVAAYLELVVTGKPVVLGDVIEHIRFSQQWPNEDDMFEVPQVPTDEASASLN